MNPQHSQLLSANPLRIPTAGRIRAGIKVLTRKAAGHPGAQEIYDRGVAQGRSFDDIEKDLLKAFPKLSSPLVPHNVPWFSVRPQDFVHPSLAHQIVDRFAQDRGQGRQVYSFPVVFPADHWPVVMPHELAMWSASQKRYWSEYIDGQRMCRCKVQPGEQRHSGKRVIRIFGGRQTKLREDNQGRCEPEQCPEYQSRLCNLVGRFVFYIPGIRSLSAFELPTRSFYAMSAAMQMFEAVRSLRGGRLAGFIDHEHTPFYFSKRQVDVSHVDEDGQVVRMPQWIIDLHAPVDVAELLAQRDDAAVVTQRAQVAVEVLQGPAGELPPAVPAPAASVVEPPLDRERILDRVQSLGLEVGAFEAYAVERWGPGWALNPKGRQRVWDELLHHVDDPQAYADDMQAYLSGAQA